MKKILFLGYDESKTKIISMIREKNYIVEHSCKQKFNTENIDLIVSFGYKFIIPEMVINSTKADFINLHISYLPWNKGAHPNFWSFYDETPKGVTIHLMNKGIDTGDIIFQKEIKFNKTETTFVKTYFRLIKEIEDLFLEKFEDILDRNYIKIPQKNGEGTFHYKADLPYGFNNWDSNIKDELKLLKNH